MSTKLFILNKQIVHQNIVKFNFSRFMWLVQNRLFCSFIHWHL